MQSSPRGLGNDLREQHPAGHRHVEAVDVVSDPRPSPDRHESVASLPKERRKKVIFNQGRLRARQRNYRGEIRQVPASIRNRATVAERRTLRTLVRMPRASLPITRTIPGEVCLVLAASATAPPMSVTPPASAPNTTHPLSRASLRATPATARVSGCSERNARVWFARAPVRWTLSPARHGVRPPPYLKNFGICRVTWTSATSVAPDEALATAARTMVVMFS